MKLSFPEKFSELLNFKVAYITQKFTYELARCCKIKYEICQTRFRSVVAQLLSYILKNGKH